MPGVDFGTCDLGNNFIHLHVSANGFIVSGPPLSLAIVISSLSV